MDVIGEGLKLDTLLVRKIVEHLDDRLITPTSLVDTGYCIYEDSEIDSGCRDMLVELDNTIKENQNRDKLGLLDKLLEKEEGRGLILPYYAGFKVLTILKSRATFNDIRKEARELMLYFTDLLYYNIERGIGLEEISKKFIKYSESMYVNNEVIHTFLKLYNAYESEDLRRLENYNSIIDDYIFVKYSPIFKGVQDSLLEDVLKGYASNRAVELEVSDIHFVLDMLDIMGLSVSDKYVKTVVLQMVQKIALERKRESLVTPQKEEGILYLLKIRSIFSQVKGEEWNYTTARRITNLLYSRDN